MDFDSKYSAPIRLVFRILAVIISIPMLSLGCLILFELIFKNHKDLQGSLKVAIPQILFGILFFISGVKGQLPKWMDGEDENRSTRVNCAKGLIGPFLIIGLSISLFYMNLFSVIWWIVLIYLIFTLYLFYLTSVVLLEEKGFKSNALAFTFVFPIALLVLGVINPQKYEEI